MLIGAPSVLAAQTIDEPELLKIVDIRMQLQGCKDNHMVLDLWSNEQGHTGRKSKVNCIQH